MFWFFLISAIPILATALLGVYWNEVREEVAGWLQQKGLHKSLLMDTWILLDRQVSSVRSRIFVRTQSREIKISEKNLAIDQIDDPEIRQALRDSGHFQRSILKLIE